MYTRIQISENDIQLQNSYGGRWVFWLITLFGFVLLAVGSLLSLASLDGDPESLYSLAIGLILSTIGFVAFYTGLRSPARGFLDQTTFQRGGNALIQTQALRSSESCTVPVETWQSVVMRAVPGNQNQSNSLQALFLKLSDGSYFWLASSTSLEKLEELQKALSDYSGCDLSHAEETRTASFEPRVTSPQRGLNRPAWQATRSGASKVISNYKSSYNWLGMQPIRTTLFMKFMTFLIILFFLLVPGVIGLQQWAANPESAPSILFMLGAGIFGFFWYSIIFLVILLQLKRVQMANRSDALLVRVDFRWLPFFKRELIIPVGNIQALPVHRVEDSHWQLSLVLNEKISMSFWTRLILGLAYKPGPPGTGLLLANEAITLIDIPAYIKESQGPGPGDIMELRRRLLEGLAQLA